MCGSRNNPQCKPRAPLVPSKVGFPGDRLAMDIVGPFPKSDQGKKYVLLESLSKWRFCQHGRKPEVSCVVIDANDGVSRSRLKSTTAVSQLSRS